MLPPVAMSAWVYGTPTFAFARDVVLMARLVTDATFKVNCLVADWPPASVTCTVMAYWPICPCDAVPVNTPCEESENPAGGMPPMIVHEYGAVPPEAARAWLYGTPGLAFGNEAVVMAGPPDVPAMETVKSFSACAPVLSRSRTTNWYGLPMVVFGVPLMTPVPPFRDSPTGSAPEITDQVYGTEPPVPCKVC